MIRGVVLVACILLAGCEMFPESNFMLSTESRLTHWFQLPEGLTRSEVSVELLYYIDHATFVLRNKGTGRQLARTRAQLLNDRPLVLQHSLSRDEVTPNYSIARVNGIVEIVEHKRREAVFDISDDPDVRTKLLTMSGHTELLK